MNENIKILIENAVSAERFSITPVMKLLELLPSDIQSTISLLSKNFSKPEMKKLLQGVIRQSFLIELVKDDISSTKFEIRWTNRLVNDTRYCTFDNCLAIFNNLLKTLSQANNEEIKIVKTFINNQVLAYELPIDYIDRKPSNNNIHSLSNINWFFTSNINDTILLREMLLSKTTPGNTIFKKILDDKIKVKTYLTDRAQTGEHKTNREKRWETHPNSVQFALRRDCLAIEKTLLLQICCFEGAPDNIVNYLKDKEILSNTFSYHKCPITLDNIQYTEFMSDIETPTHGKSKFQVGHLNPLKTADNDIFGHSAQNISWISEDGNRIQGSLSLAEVNDLLTRILKNRNNQ
ncbi:hypothetical protein ACSXAD_07505 [Clostridium perfringens]